MLARILGFALALFMSVHELVEMVAIAIEPTREVMMQFQLSAPGLRSGELRASESNQKWWIHGCRDLRHT